MPRRLVMKNARIVTVAVLSAAAVASCSMPGVGSGEPDPAATTSIADSSSAVPVDSIEALVPKLSVADKRTIWEGQRELVRKCMKGKGIDFTFPPFEKSYNKDKEQEDFSQRVSRPDLAFASVEWSSTHGYGIDGAVVKEIEGGHLGPQEDVPFDAKTQAALYGTSEDPTVQIPQPDGTVVNTYAAGCYWDSQVRLYGDGKKWLQASYDVESLISLSKQKVMADPVVAIALNNWKSCMQTKGWSGLQHQEDAYAAAYSAYRSGESNAQQKERSLAVADAQCTRSSKYDVSKRQAERKVISNSSDQISSVILSFAELRSRGLEEATKVLSGG